MRAAFRPFLFFVALAFPPAAQAQDADRLNRLERDLQLIQRQLARGEVSGEDGADHGGGFASVEVRLGRIDEEMRQLRGRLEENEFRIRRMDERLERLQKDVDFRFDELSAARAAANADLATSNRPALSAPQEEAKAKPEMPSDDTDALARMVEEIANEQSAGETAPEASETPEETVAPETPEEKLQATSAGSGTLLPPGEAEEGPRELYNSAFKLLNQTKYDEAARQFERFTSEYPEDPLIGNAYYWLGETHYIKRDYVQAADQFRRGFEALPTGPKAADNLLKLAMSLSGLKKEKESCVVLDQILLKFKKNSTAVTEKAQQERTRIGCQ